MHWEASRSCAPTAAAPTRLAAPCGPGAQGGGPGGNGFRTDGHFAAGEDVHLGVAVAPCPAEDSSPPALRHAALALP